MHVIYALHLYLRFCVATKEPCVERATAANRPASEKMYHSRPETHAGGAADIKKRLSVSQDLASNRAGRSERGRDNYGFRHRPGVPPPRWSNWNKTLARTLKHTRDECRHDTHYKHIWFGDGGW